MRQSIVGLNVGLNNIEKKAKELLIEYAVVWQNKWEIR